jgi:Dolichyl-phosphate-mannose-protein mannosyltransferase
MAALHAAAAFHYRIDSDETQHLHVVWGWTRGLLQYRQIFDNHAPLFQMLMAPLLAVLPEAPSTVLWMRAAMLPFYLLSLWATYRIAAALYNRRIGLWAAVLAGLIPSYFFCSAEFRTDDLWAAFWLLAVAALARENRGRKGSALCGFFLGAALATSLKTTVLLSCLGASLLLIRAFLFASGAPLEWRSFLRNLAAGLAGFVILPGAIVAYFAFRHALPDLYSGTIRHNLAAQGRFIPKWSVFWLAALAVAVASWLIFRFSPRENRARRASLFFTAGVYFTAILTIWPLVEREHFLPFFPLLAVFATAAIFGAASWICNRFAPLPRWAGEISSALVLALALGELHLVWKEGQFHITRTGSVLSVIRDTLLLTEPNDCVIDQKGETVFRPRAFFYVAEPVTRTRIAMGLIKDDTAERVVATGAAVAVGDSRNFSSGTRAFLDAHYVNAGAIRVLGGVLGRNVAAQKPLPFQIIIPGAYSISDGRSAIPGVLDGTPSAGSRRLEIGEHQFLPGADAALLYVIWSKALEAGLEPRPAESLKASKPRATGKLLEKLLD